MRRIGSIRERMRKQSTVLRKRVDIGGSWLAISVTTQMVATERIHGDQEYIGFGLHRLHVSQIVQSFLNYLLFLFGISGFVLTKKHFS